MRPIAKRHGTPSYLNVALLAAFLAAIGAAVPAHAAVLATYDFTGQAQGLRTPGATSADSNVTASTITATANDTGTPGYGVYVDTATGIVPSEPYLRFNNPSPTSTLATQAQAVSTNAYFTFTVTAAPGYTLDLSSLTFLASKGGSQDPRGFAMQTSATGFSTNSMTNINTGTSDGTNTNQTINGTGAVSANYSTAVSTAVPNYSNFNIDLTGASYQNLSSIEFRIFSFTPFQNQAFVYDNFVLNGTAASAVPEPASLALLGLGALALIRRRRA